MKKGLQKTCNHACEYHVLHTTTCYISLSITIIEVGTTRKRVTLKPQIFAKIWSDDV